MQVSIDRSWFKNDGYDKCVRSLGLWRAYGRDREPARLKDIIAHLTSAQSDATTPAGLAFCHFHAGEAYFSRYGVTGSLNDLTWALRTMRQALEEDHPGHERGYRLRLIAEALIAVLELLDPGESPASEHLILAERWVREAIPLLEGDEISQGRSDLALVLVQKARHLGQGDALGAAVEILREVIEAATSDKARAGYIGNLGKAYGLLYQHRPSEDLAVLLVQTYDEAAKTSPADDPNHEIHLRQQFVTRQMLGLQDLEMDNDSWVEIDGGVRINVETGEVVLP